MIHQGLGFQDISGLGGLNHLGESKGLQGPSRQPGTPLAQKQGKLAP